MRKRCGVTNSVGKVKNEFFIPRDAMLAQYMLRLCVCPSVRLCLSQVGVLLKWLNIVSLRDVNEPIFLLFRHCTPTIASVVNSIRPSLVYHTERPPPSTARCREAARCAVRRRQPILAEF